MKAFHRRTLCAALIALLTASVLTACGSDDDSTDSATDAVTTTGEVTTTETSTETERESETTSETVTETEAESVTESATDTESLTETETETVTETESETTTETETEAPDLSLWIVKDGESGFVIRGTDDTVKYTLSDQITSATGVRLSVVPADAEIDAEGYLSFDTAEDVGNYGYRITLTGTVVKISAASLAGYDKAIDRLIADATVEGGLKLAPDYAAEEILNWDTDYNLQGAEDYKESYRDGVFYNDKNDSVAYVSNAMWSMFGLVNDGQNLVYRFGNEPTWFEWMSEKVAWSGDAAYIGELKGKLQNFAQTETGYMWSWGDKPYWQVDTCYSIHYDGTFRYISAVYDVISWENSTDFLYVKDTSAAGGTFASVDASNGRTILEKTEKCMEYILEYLYGKEGYIQITEPSTFLNADGSQRFDYVPGADMYCWNNTGLPNSNASNYWDNLPFGNYDAYENALFYQALNSMAGIYRMLGDKYAGKAAEMDALAETVKAKYNELYWDEEKGRYIACIDTDGTRVDYGLTFVNFEAMKYGLASPEQAKRIFDWIDGDRVIEGEKTVGRDIMSYAQIMRRVNRKQYEIIKELDLRLAAITNTIPINNRENQASGLVWWHGPDGINPFASAAYGNHLENGGYIFYPVFYELMARTEYEGAQSTTDRLYEIGRVYEYNRLVSDGAVSGSTNWLEGLIGEFPESGLVPTVYLYSLLGVSAENDGMHITPAFNEVYETMGVKKLTYGGKDYAVEVRRDGSMTLTPAAGEADLTLVYTPERFGDRAFTVTYNTASGSVSETVEAVNGIVTVVMDGVKADSIVLEPVLKND